MSKTRSTVLAAIVGISIVIVIALALPACAQNGFAGCTPGYWKNHVDEWASTGYSPSDPIENIFAEVPPQYFGKTLLEGLHLKGGGENALIRQALAAILNASHPYINYPLTGAQVIADVNAAFASLDSEAIEALKDILNIYNDLGCPL